MKTAAVLVLAVVGLFFSLSGAVGILRMPDLYTRIQCSSKTITMGALPALIALVVGEGVISNYASRALIIAALLVIVNPAASHALGRAAHKAGVPMWSGAVRDETADRASRASRADDGSTDGDGGGDRDGDRDSQDDEDGEGAGDGDRP